MRMIILWYVNLLVWNDVWTMSVNNFTGMNVLYRLHWYRWCMIRMHTTNFVIMWYIIVMRFSDALNNCLHIMHGLMKESMKLLLYCTVYN